MLLDKRKNLKPYEYPELYKYVDAIRASYWIHTEFSFTSDIQDFKSELSESEREIIKRTMLAISQIEVSVKTFWGELHKHIPKPEISSVGFTFAESEIRHSDAYSNLLELLGLNKEFENIDKTPAIIDRMDYLDKAKSTKTFANNLILFSLFIEHISLFSQFLIMLSFSKHKNVLKGISNVIEATSKEEDLHGKFGIELVGILKKEYPEQFTQESIDEVIRLADKALLAEEKVIDWIFETGELEFLPRDVIVTFIKDRFNKAFKALGIDRKYPLDKKLLEQTEWFDDEMNTTKHTDFFYKRPTNYNKKSKSITEDDLY